MDKVLHSRLRDTTLATHQAGYPEIASKARDSITGPQIEVTKIKGLLGYPRRAQRYFWVAVGAMIIKKMNG